MYLAVDGCCILLSQLRDDRDPIELWSADYTFLNEQLARHYGIPGRRPASSSAAFHYLRRSEPVCSATEES